MKLRDIKRSASALNLKQLVKLDAWLHSVIEMAEHVGGHHPTEHTAAQKSYRRQMVRWAR